NATTEKPASASLHASVPPPAPVPTIAKSTSSLSPKQRMGTHLPSRKTSGARPLRARGSATSSIGGLEVELFGFPRIALLPAEPPRIAHRRHVGVAIAGRAVVVEHVVDPRDDRHRFVAVGLRHQAIGDRLQQRPFLLREEPALRNLLQPLPDGCARLVVPRGR